jgi:hypothetical protein
MNVTFKLIVCLVRACEEICYQKQFLLRLPTGSAIILSLVPLPISHAFRTPTDTPPSVVLSLSRSLSLSVPLGIPRVTSE